MGDMQPQYSGTYEAKNGTSIPSGSHNATMSSTSSPQATPPGLVRENSKIDVAKNILQDLILHPDAGIVSPEAIISAGLSPRDADSFQLASHLDLDEYEDKDVSYQHHNRHALGGPELDELLNRDKMLLNDHQLGLVRRRNRQVIDHSRKKKKDVHKIQPPSVADKPTIATVVRVLQTTKPERRPPPEKPTVVSFDPLNGARTEYPKTSVGGAGSTQTNTVRVTKTELSHLRHALKHTARRQHLLQAGLLKDSSDAAGLSGTRSTDNLTPRDVKSPRVPKTLPAIVQNPRHRQRLIDVLISKPISASLSHRTQGPQSAGVESGGNE